MRPRSRLQMDYGSAGKNPTDVWQALPLVVTVIGVGLYHCLQSEWALGLLRWAIDGSLLAAGGVMAWRGRGRPLRSLLSASVVMIAIGIAVAALLSTFLDPGLSEHWLIPVLVVAGFLAAGLSWVVLHFVLLGREAAGVFVSALLRTRGC
jgi:hypothetical protein